jgi:hypothetical protein
MRPRSASGTPVPAGLDSCSGVCPRGWLRCERPAPSPPRRRGGSRTLPRREVSSLAPSCHCAPALPGLFFFELGMASMLRGPRRSMLRCSMNRASRSSAMTPLLRHRTHYGVRAWFFSTACWLWRDAPCLLLTDLVRSVYGPGSRDVAFGCATDTQRARRPFAILPTSIGAPMAQRLCCGEVAGTQVGQHTRGRTPTTTGDRVTFAVRST